MKECAKKTLTICAVISFISICIVIYRYRHYILPIQNDGINSDITISAGTIISALLVPLWSIVAALIYYSALELQSKELKASKEATFCQNLISLISYSITALDKIYISVPTLKTFNGEKALTFLYVSLKYSYNIIDQEKITPIPNWDKYIQEEKEQEEYNRDNTLAEEHILEKLAQTNIKEYHDIKTTKNFNQNLPRFIHILEFNGDENKWKKHCNSQHAHVRNALNKVLHKFERNILHYLQSIESIIGYIDSQNIDIAKKHQYAQWFTNNIGQTNLAFLFYYVCCTKEQKEELYKKCIKLKIFERLRNNNLLLGAEDFTLFTRQ